MCRTLTVFSQQHQQVAQFGLMELWVSDYLPCCETSTSYRC